MHTIPGFLQQKLNELDLDFDVEVINAGVPGQYSFGELYLIKNKIIKFEPDLIIIYDGWNDSQNRNYIEPDLDQIEKQNQEPNQNFTFKNFPFYRTPHVVFTLFFHETFVAATGESVRDEVVRLWKERMTEACSLGNEKGFDILIAVQPIIGAGNKTLSEHEKKFAPNTEHRIETVTILNRLANSLNEIEQSCQYTVDLRSVFDDISEPVYFDEGHMVDYGNEIVAQKLFESSHSIILENQKK